MVKKFAVIENGIVVNVIDAIQEFIDDNNIKAIECESFVYPGYLYDDGLFHLPQVAIENIADEETDGETL